MDNPPVGSMGPVAPLLALVVLLAAAFAAEAFRALRWRDPRRFRRMALIGALLSVPAAALLAAASLHPGMLAWRWPTGFGPEWRCAQNLPAWAAACVRTGPAFGGAREGAAAH